MPRTHTASSGAKEHWICGIDTRCHPRPHGCVKLTGTDNEWRIRVGAYRVIYEIHDQVLLIVLIDVGHRREIYR